MKKILVPVDFSEHTKSVCRFALEIAKVSGGEIRLFHAYFDLFYAPSSTFPFINESADVINPDLIANIRAEARSEMLKLQTDLEDELELNPLGNVRIVHTLTGGIPQEEILNISETYQPDLIVMGTRGKGDKDNLTGKVSSKVVKNATCRILTVPKNAIYHGFKNVLYATDFNDEDKDDIVKLIELTSNYKPVIHCIHVDIDNKLDENLSKMNDLKSNFKEQIEAGSIIFDFIRNTDFLNGINDYVAQHKIDMISLVHRRKGFIKRIFIKDHTHELLFHSDIPLYIFPGR